MSPLQNPWTAYNFRLNKIGVRLSLPVFAHTLLLFFFIFRVLKAFSPEGGDFTDFYNRNVANKRASGNK